MIEVDAGPIDQPAFGFQTAASTRVRRPDPVEGR